ncbi:MAG: ParB/RepB/Spo0J family partition protein [Rhodospirillales bacterium]|nr:ParB/RepB/Spo0J family partition protein [Rhodospirillales bacterium]
MAEATKRKKGLGRGLSSLLGEDKTTSAPASANENGTSETKGNLKSLPIEFLRPGLYQPRHIIEEGPIEELAESIRDKGILQPILVRKLADGPESYEIIAGERRWRAAQLAQLHEVPVIVRDLDDQTTLEIALIENLQREDLSPLEEADAYSRLMDEFSHTQEALAKSVGKSRSHVANMMRLLGLPDTVKLMMDTGELSAGHARALLKADDPIALARQVSDRGLNVRQTEKLVQQGSKESKSAPAKRKTINKDTDTLALERDLTNSLGLKVEVNYQGSGGSLVLHYGSLEQLDDLLHRLSHGSLAGNS